LIDAIRNALVARLGERLFYGWVIVATANLGIFASGPGQSHTFSVFVEPISTDLGISSATIATAYGAATLVAAFLLPQTGRMVDRFGPRKALIGIIVLLGFACLLFGAAANFLWLAVGFAALRFIGQGSLMLGCANIVSQWFVKLRGFAMSLMALGFGISMAIHPPLGQFLIDTVGWRTSWYVLGGMTWLLMLPPLVLLAIDKPEDVGLQPDGEQPLSSTAGSNTKVSITGLSLHEAMQTVSFYVVSFGWCCTSMLVTTLHFWQVTVMTRQGVATDTAAQAFTISAVAMALAMPLVGAMFDRMRTRYVFAIGLLVTATSLNFVTFATDTLTTIAYAVVFGINNAFSMTMFGYLWPRYFGRKHLGSIQGTGQMIGVVGASIGPFPVGWAIDTIGDPTWTLRLLAILPALAALLAVAYLRAPSAVTESAHLE
jgi:MFS family permease